MEYCLVRLLLMRHDDKRGLSEEVLFRMPIYRKILTNKIFCYTI